MRRIALANVVRGWSILQSCCSGMRGVTAEEREPVYGLERACRRRRRRQRFIQTTGTAKATRDHWHCDGRCPSIELRWPMVGLPKFIMWISKVKNILGIYAEYTTVVLRGNKQKQRVAVPDRLMYCTDCFFHVPSSE